MIEPSVYERVFQTTFLANAPLYRDCKKVKLPHESITGLATLYHGSLKDEERTVEQIADYRMLKDADDAAEVRKCTEELATNLAILVDGLIRIENGRNRDGANIHDTSATIVTDLFEHFDGRRNLNFLYASHASLIDPGSAPIGWVAYRCYLAVAKVRMEYKS